MNRRQSSHADLGDAHGEVIRSEGAVEEVREVLGERMYGFLPPIR
jgi:hypothetical protein